MEDDIRQPLLNNRPAEEYDILDAARRKHNAIIGILAVLFVASVAVIAVLVGKDSIAPTPESHNTPDALALSIRTSMSDSADPCNDFYEYACGGWLQSTTIPPDKNSWSRSFSVIQEQSLTMLREILEDGEKTIEGKFYLSCMDETRVNNRELPLLPLLDQIRHKLNESGALMTSALLLQHGVSSLFSIAVEVDMKSPKEYLIGMSQDGLGLPDRDYYFDDSYQAIRKDYLSYVSKLLQLSGVPPDAAAAQASLVFDFEKTLANFSLKREDLRDAEKLYHKHNLEWLVQTYPSLPWLKYFTEAFGKDADVPIDAELEVNVATPLFFEGLEKALNTSTREQLNAYFRFHAMHSFSSVLSDAVRNATFAFFGQQLSGQEQQPPRWKKCVGMTDSNLPDALGKTYSSLHFTWADKRVAQDLIKKVEEAFKDNLVSVRWMDNKTRQATEEKLQMIANNVGFPDKWIDYSSLSPMGPDLFENEVAIRKFETIREIKRLGKPVDRDEWEMSAPTVNAYYSPTENKMVFPAGILRLPFFDRAAPAAVNFGSIGMVMGHELTHAFDDEGRKFDGEGKLRDWWEESVINKFDNETKCVENQFSQYLVAGTDVHQSGKLTLGENIADLGGIKTSYKAFQTYKQNRRTSQIAIDHPSSLKFLSEDQLFFVAFAQGWCEHRRDQFSQLLAKTDPHSPPRNRVMGALANVPEFAAAFHCSVNSSMVRKPEDVCQVW